jgi:ABC-type Zn uptake system ZnuABC Zn-binding protein ZnuA
MNKLIALLLTLVLLAGLIPCAGCAEDKTLTVVTTIFPIYDWVRQIAAFCCLHGREQHV